MNDSLIVRPITKAEIGFLDRMLYNAIFVPPGNERLPDNIIEHPLKYQNILRTSAEKVISALLPN